MSRFDDDRVHRRLQAGLVAGDLQRLVGGHGLAGRHLVRPRRDPDNPRDHTVRAYDIDPDLVPIFDEALRRLGRYPSL